MTKWKSCMCGIVNDVDIRNMFNERLNTYCTCGKLV